MLGWRTALKADNIGKFGVVGNDTNTLGCVHRRTAANSHNKVGAGGCKRLNTHLHVGHRWIRLNLAVHLISDAGFVEHIGHHLGNAKFNQALVGYNQRLFESQTRNNTRKLLAGTRSEVRHFVENKSIYHI